MKKSDLVKLQKSQKDLAQITESMEERLLQIIQSSFSGLATANPEMAIIVIDQLCEQKKDIKKLAKEREAGNKEYVKKMTAMIPDHIEFSEED